MALQPKVLWAQTKEAIFLTTALAEAKSLKVDLQENSLDVSGVKGGQKYSFSLHFTNPINTAESKYTTFRELKFKLVKKEPQRWSSVDSRGKLHWLQCDWDKWIDTDDEENGDQFDAGFDPSNFSMPDGNYDDSDDEEDGLGDLNESMDDKTLDDSAMKDVSEDVDMGDLRASDEHE